MSVLFADVVGFTGLSESLDPEQVKHLVDAAFQRLVRDVVAFGGRVDKIVGDGLMALFGAPVAHEDDPERAVRAALRMHETIEEFSAEGDIDLRLRIGVTTGEVLVGALAAGGDYTAMGDVVNTAARLQTAADPGTVLVGAATHAATEHAIRYESKGSIFVRGREGSVNIWRPIEAIALPGSRPWSPRIPLVGREGEMALLVNAAVISIHTKRAQQLLLIGHGGVGKSRLASELAELLAGEQQMQMLSGRCVPYGESNGWSPVASIVRQGCGVEEGDEADLARSRVEWVVGELWDRALDDLAPAEAVHGLLHVMGYETPLRALDSHVARGASTEALVAFMRAALRRGPIVVELTDLHWADESVLQLSDEISARLGQTPLVLIATARRSLLRRWSPRLGRANTLILNVEPLGVGDARSLLDELTIGRGFSEELRAEILDRSGGNPLFMEELVRFVESDPAGHASGPLRLPDNLRGLVAARIDALGPAERAVLEDAAVWGPSGTLRVLDRMAAGRGREVDVVPGVRALVDLEILEVDGVDWRFRFDVAREVAYSQLTKTDRMQRHHRIATFLEHILETRPADDLTVETLARHYAEAVRTARSLAMVEALGEGVVERALFWVEQAGGRAEQAASWPVASRQYTLGLELAGGDQPEVRLRLLLGRARAHLELWDFDEVQVDAHEARRLADQMGDRAAHAWVRLVEADLTRRRGQLDRARRRIEVALTEFEELDDMTGQAASLRLLGLVLLFQGDAAAAVEPIEQALELYRELHDRRGEAWALQNLAWAGFGAGRFREAQEWVEEAARVFDETGDRSGQLWSAGLRAHFAFISGRREEARQTATRVLEQVESLRDPWGEGMMCSLLASLALWDGATQQAVEMAQRAVACLEAIGEPVGLARAQLVLGAALVHSGRVRLGLDTLEHAGRRLPGAQAERTLVTCLVRTELGDTDVLRLVKSAQEEVGDSADDPMGTELLAVISRAQAQRGRYDEGVKALESGWGLPVVRDGASPNLLSAFALLAALGPMEVRAEGRKAAERVVGDPSATFMDRAHARIAHAALLVEEDEPGEAWAALEAAWSEVAATEDLLAQAVVTEALAKVAPVAAPDRAADLATDNDRRWRALDRRPRGWEQWWKAVLAAA